MNRYYPVYLSDTEGQHLDQLHAVRNATIEAIKNVDVHKEVVRVNLTFGIVTHWRRRTDGKLVKMRKPKVCQEIEIKIFLNGSNSMVRDNRHVRAYKAEILKYLRAYPPDLFKNFEIHYEIVRCVRVTGGSLKPICKDLPARNSDTLGHRS